MAKRRIYDDELHAQPFWQPEHCPFNLYCAKKALEKLDTMHKNAVTAGVVK